MKDRYYMLVLAFFSFHIQPKYFVQFYPVCTACEKYVPVSHLCPNTEKSNGNAFPGNPDVVYIPYNDKHSKIKAVYLK